MTRNMLKMTSIIFEERLPEEKNMSADELMTMAISGSNIVGIKNYLQLTEEVVTALANSFWINCGVKAGFTAFKTPLAAFEKTLNILLMADKLQVTQDTTFNLNFD